MKKYPKEIFITGTDTDVGKTVISSILAVGLDAHYWKPVQSGLDDCDTDPVKKNTGFSDESFFPERFRLNAPLSPHISASLDGISIGLDDFNPPEKYERLIVEGAGGVMVPLNKNDFMADLMKKLGFPVIIVARSGLGTINHTLLTIDYLRKKGVDIFGVVMNGEKNSENREAIEHYGKVMVIGEISEIKNINYKTLKEAFNEFRLQADHN